MEDESGEQGYQCTCAVQYMQWDLKKKEYERGKSTVNDQVGVEVVVEQKSGGAQRPNVERPEETLN